VNGVRFTGEKTQFYCMSCGNYYINPIKHAILHCCETQLARTKFWERITDFFPMELVANINSLDEDNYILCTRLLETCIPCKDMTIIKCKTFTLSLRSRFHR
jgi:hypothetical protein